jgi:hypothetical protein
MSKEQTDTRPSQEEPLAGEPEVCLDATADPSSGPQVAVEGETRGAAPPAISAEKVAEVAQKVSEGVASAVRVSEAGSRLCVRWTDGLLGWSRRTFRPEAFDSLSGWLVRWGQISLPLAQLLVLAYGLTAAIKLSDASFLAFGVGMAVAMFILQYVASRFLGSGKRLVDVSPTRVGSAAFLDCTALLAEVAGIALFVGSFSVARQLDQWSLLWVGAGLWALCDAVAYVALHPTLVNVTVSESATAGEEALGILSFLAKAKVRIAPAAFGIGCILGTLGLLLGWISLIRTGNPAACQSALWLTIGSTALPFAVYVGYALYQLGIDVIAAILNLPRRIEKAGGSDHGG